MHPHGWARIRGKTMKTSNNEPKKAMKTGIEGRGRPSSRWDEPVLGRVFQGLRPRLISVVALRHLPTRRERWEKGGSLRAVKGKRREGKAGFFPERGGFSPPSPSFRDFSTIFYLSF